MIAFTQCAPFADLSLNEMISVAPPPASYFSVLSSFALKSKRHHAGASRGHGDHADPRPLSCGTTATNSSADRLATSPLAFHGLTERSNVWGRRSVIATLGYISDEVAGMPGLLVETLVHEDAVARAEHMAGLLSLPDGRPREFEYRFCRLDGSCIWVLNRDTIIRRQVRLSRADRRRRHRCDETCEVLEELARNKAELERLIEVRTAALLRQSEKLRPIDELTAGIAHDLKNLLQVVVSGVHLLKSPSLSEAQKGTVLEGLEKSAASAAELVSQLLSFAGRQKLSPEPVDVGQMLGGMAALLHRTLSSGVTVVTELPPALPFAYVDASQLEMALLNLVMNARDAMPSGGTLTLSARSVTREPGEKSVICVTVEDTGAGMPPAVLQRASEPFFTTKGKGKGTGLGLPQVYGFAKQSGGDVSIESALGRGTKISIYLPCSDSAGEQQLA